MITSPQKRTEGLKPAVSSLSSSPVHFLHPRRSVEKSVENGAAVRKKPSSPFTLPLREVYRKTVEVTVDVPRVILSKSHWP